MAREVDMVSGGPVPPPEGRSRRCWAAWVRRIVLALVFGVFTIGTMAAVYVESLGELDLSKLGDQSTVVLDRHGKLLRPFTTLAGRWRLPVERETVDRRFIAMLKAAEDKRFDNHPGVDPLAMMRAFGQLLMHGRIVSGGSTLEMQVARLLEPRDERTFATKARQIVRALQLSRRFSKGEILDFYFQLAPYGGNLEGVRAASLAYFGREPERLSLAEAALLVALPQSPELRRPDRFPEIARQARDRILDRVAQAGVISADDATLAKTEPVPFGRKVFPMLAAHAAERAVRERPQARIHRLTIDLQTQRSLERLLAERVERIDPGLSAAAIVIDNATSELLAVVGSAGYMNVERKGAIDATLAVRSPGSALKPFVYAMAFENGIAHPETLVEDRPSRFGVYAPENFDRGYQGVLTARQALQMSLNIPVVDLLAEIGPVRFLGRLRDAGARVVLPDDTPPGLAVGLGGIGISLTDLARLYSGLARGGDAPALVHRLGEPGEGEERHITDAVSAWYIWSILKDAPPPDGMAGGMLAFKTGTSYGYRDALAVGFDRRLTVGIWVGRPDGAPVPGLVGRVVAAPLLFEAYARMGSIPVSLPKTDDVLLATTATLPPPLRHLRTDIPKMVSAAPVAALKIAYPVNGAEIDLGFTDAEGERDRLVLKASGGVMPLRWLINGVPYGESTMRREVVWTPDGMGFARISVIDASGSSDSVEIRIQ